MNNYFYDSFLDEIAEAGGRDPYELRLELLILPPPASRSNQAPGQTATTTVKPSTASAAPNAA